MKRFGIHDLQRACAIALAWNLNVHPRVMRNNMQFLTKNDIALAYEDTNTALPPLVLVHGCGLDHGSLTNQTVFFSRSHRVISVDLAHFQRLTPQLVSARTLGSGHFSPVEIPDQINAMIAQFISVQ